MAAYQIAYPEWTDCRNKSGLDPLGMQNSSINLYQRLLPGISNVTLRMRYYGLYAWLAAVYARRSRSTDIRKWQQLIRRAEALYALAAVHGRDEAGVSGSRWARRKLAASSGRVSFAEHSDPDGVGAPYLQQKWGAYGAAYGSQVFEIGVLAQAKGDEIPVPSPGLGDGLAIAFLEALGEAAIACIMPLSAAASAARNSTNLLPFFLLSSGGRVPSGVCRPCSLRAEFQRPQVSLAAIRSSCCSAPRRTSKPHRKSTRYAGCSMRQRARMADPFLFRTIA